jgi:hypothetical protein
MRLFSPELYQPLFLAIVFIFTIINYFRIKPLTSYGLLQNRSRIGGIFLLTVAFILIVGLRPISSAFGDTVNYAYMYELLRDASSFRDVIPGGEIIFNSIMFHCSKVMDVSFFFLIIEVIYVVPIYLACRKLAGNNSGIMMLFCFAAFSFFSYGVNGIRNGMACSLIILALSLVQGNTRDKIICVILCLLAIGCHKSTVLPVICMLMALFIKNPRVMFIFWVGSILLSLAEGSQIESFFVSLGFDDRMDEYLHAEEETMEQFSSVGFRWDFLLYSCVPIVMGWYLIFRKRFYNRTYLLLLGTYIFANAFWIMVIRASFSNRFAYLSWFLYPIVMSYPLLKLPIWKRTQGRNTGLIMLGHYAFTLVLFLIGK